MRNAQIHKVVELPDRRVKRALGRERPGVEFIEDGALERPRLKSIIRPRECSVVVDARESMNSTRLPQRARIRIDAAPFIYLKSVIGPRSRVINTQAPPALRIGSLHRRGRVLQFEADARCSRCP